MSKTNSSGYQVTKMTESELREEVSKIEPEEKTHEDSFRAKCKYNLRFAKDMRRVTKGSGARRLETNLQDIMSIFTAGKASDTGSKIRMLLLVSLQITGTGLRRLHMIMTEHGKSL